MPIIVKHRLPKGFDDEGRIILSENYLIYLLPNLGLFEGKAKWKERVREEFGRWMDFKTLNKQEEVLPLKHNEEEEKIISKWLNSDDKYPPEDILRLLAAHRLLGNRGKDIR